MPNHNMGAATRRRRKRKLFRRYGSRCCYCRQSFPFEELTIEHRKPRSLGGSNAMWNLRLACASCNQRRGTARQKLGSMVIEPDPMVAEPCQASPEAINPETGDRAVDLDCELTQPADPQN